MKLTIREALELTPLKNARILAGEAGLDRVILNVNIVEVPDTVRWMRGGEIMFSSGFAFSGDATKGIELLSSLNNHNISALVLKPGVYMSTIPEQMIHYADQISFPLLEVPRDMPFNTYVESIYALLLDKRTFLFSSDPTPYYTLRENPVVSGDLNNICNILAEQIHAYVLYLSISGSIEEVFPNIESADTELMNTQPQAIPEWEKTHYLTQVSVDLEPQAYLAVKKDGDFPRATDVAMMEYTTMVLASILQKEKAFIEHKKQYRSALLNDLIMQNYGDRNIFKRRCELLQFNVSNSYLAFAIHFMSDGTQWGDSETPDSTKNYVCSILEHSSVHHGCSVLLADDEDLIVGVFSFNSTQNPVETARRVFNGMLDKFSIVCMHARASVGMSGLVSDIEQIARATNEAKEAVYVNSRLEHRKSVVTLEELGIYRVLCELKSSKAMINFCDSMLHDLLKNDKDGKLLKTLECYYENEGNLRKTSEALYLHKNSLKYRLSRIEQLLGKSISDPDVQLDIRLCLKYRKIQ